MKSFDISQLRRFLTPVYVMLLLMLVFFGLGVSL
ncbi:MAG: hypothetical protein RLZZ189_1618 [Pseudomonadota bacterium]